jgi:tRNA pseudouridine38-40 synthase
MKFRATVSYDGTAFGGFQRQVNARSVQGEIEAALEKISGKQVGVVGAGRTDAGVHATGQVIAFGLDWSHGAEALTKAINVSLPMDVAVREVAECDERFHPRFDAVSRTYEYTIEIAPVRRPLTRLYAWQLEQDLEISRMSEAARHLIGQHDFAAFGSATSGESTVRTVFGAEWKREWKETQAWLKFTIEANGFLFRMVRRIVASLVRVGQGKISPDEVREILLSRDGNQAKGAAPACGLNLVSVKYED